MGTDEAMEALYRYHWLGNVRELENAVEHALVVEKADVMQLGDLPFEIQRLLGQGQLQEIETSPYPSQRKPYRKASRRQCLEAIEQCGGNKVLAARRLKNIQGHPLQKTQRKLMPL